MAAQVKLKTEFALKKNNNDFRRKIAQDAQEVTIIKPERKIKAEPLAILPRKKIFQGTSLDSTAKGHATTLDSPAIFGINRLIPIQIFTSNEGDISIDNPAPNDLGSQNYIGSMVADLTGL